MSRPAPGRWLNPPARDLRLRTLKRSVSWTVETPPVGTWLARAAKILFVGVPRWFLTSSVREEDPSWSQAARVAGSEAGDPTRVLLSGIGGGLSRWQADFETATPVRVLVDGATITPGARELVLPLRDVVLVGAAYRGFQRGPGRRSPYSPWELHLEGPGISWTMRGPWILLAHLGALAEWPEPPLDSPALLTDRTLPARAVQRRPPPKSSTGWSPPPPGNRTPPAH